MEQTDFHSEFIVESREGLQTVEDRLLAAERDPESRLEILDEVFRVVHSMKGSGSFLGFNTLVSLAHEAETVMDRVRSGKQELDHPTMDAVLGATDRLLELLDTENVGEGADISAQVDALTALAPQTVAPNTPQQTAQNETHYRIKAEISSLKTLASCRNGIHQGFSEAGTILSMAPEPDDENASGTVEVELLSPLPIAILSELFALNAENVEVTSASETQPTTSEPEPESDVLIPIARPQEAPVQSQQPTKAESKEHRTNSFAAKKEESTMRVSTRFLDDMLAFTSNMVMARNQLLSRYQFQDDMSFATLSHCITDIHKSVVQQRMQNIGAVFSRFNRLVRDLSYKLGKEVDLFIEGGDIELDRTILEAFADPLTHMVRNAIDHAIELPDDRIAAKKNRVGRLVLRAYHQSGEVIVEVEDDGKGIDVHSLGAKAVDRGVVSAEVLAKMSPKDIVNLIFEPGFSTKDQASDISGRGVGMDVVRTNIEKIGGAIEVHTNLGAGSLFAFRLPLTQAVVSSSLIAALVVEVAGQRFAIPETAVNEIIRLDPQEMADRVRPVEGRDVYQLRDRVLSIVHLEDALGLQRTWTDKDGNVHPDRRQHIADRRAGETSEQRAAMANRRSTFDRRHTKQTLIVIEFRRSFFSLMVDRVVGVEEVVVRSSPKLVENVQQFAGHTVLGDGSLVMMIDVHGIVNHAKLEFPSEDNQPLAVRGALKTAQQMVVFNNAHNEFFAVPLMMISLIERVSGDEIKQIGTREFYQFKEETIPILRLEDHLDVSGNRDQQEYHLLIPARLEKPMGILVGMDLSVEDFSDSFDSRMDMGAGLIGTAYRDERLVMLLDMYALFEHVMPDQFETVMQGRDGTTQARILMAEDNKFFAKLISSYLTQPGIDLTMAEDGQEAWDILIKERKQFDLIVSDIEMPRMNGFELVRNIKHNPDLRNIPVIALTSLADEDSRHRGIKAGFDEYAVKIDKEELLRLVFDYIDRVHGTLATAER